MRLKSDKEYVDCKLVYECSDGAGELLCHRIFMKEARWFDAFFRQKTPEAWFDENRVLNMYTLDLRNMTHELFNATVNIIYGRQAADEWKSVWWFLELLESVIFFMLTDKLVKDVLYRVVHHLEFNGSVVMRLANFSGIPARSFESFLAFHLWQVLDLTQIPSFRPQFWYQHLSRYDTQRNCVILSSRDNQFGRTVFVHDGFEYSVKYDCDYRLSIGKEGEALESDYPNPQRIVHAKFVIYSAEKTQVTCFEWVNLPSNVFFFLRTNSWGRGDQLLYRSPTQPLKSKRWEVYVFLSQ